jgi:hypothetical protein
LAAAGEGKVIWAFDDDGIGATKKKNIPQANSQFSPIPIVVRRENKPLKKELGSEPIRQMPRKPNAKPKTLPTFP